MSALEMSHVDLEQGVHRRSVTGSDVSGEGSICFSDADEGSCYSIFYSTAGGSYDEYRFDCVSEREIGGVVDSRRASSASVCSVEVGVVDGELSEIKVHLDKVERDCRICQLSSESSNPESGIVIELGCSCKNDLAAAHKSCAEQWFKIKGNKLCIHRHRRPLRILLWLIPYLHLWQRMPSAAYFSILLIRPARLTGHTLNWIFFQPNGPKVGLVTELVMIPPSGLHCSETNVLI